MSIDWEETFLEIGFTRFDDFFADGQRANNKLNLDADTLSKHPRIRLAAINRLAS
jgi:hypothetical protein